MINQTRGDQTHRGELSAKALQSLLLEHRTLWQADWKLGLLGLRSDSARVRNCPSALPESPTSACDGPRRGDTLDSDI